MASVCMYALCTHTQQCTHAHVTHTHQHYKGTAFTVTTVMINNRWPLYAKCPAASQLRSLRFNVGGDKTLLSNPYRFFLSKN